MKQVADIKKQSKMNMKTCVQTIGSMLTKTATNINYNPDRSTTEAVDSTGAGKDDRREYVVIWNMHCNHDYRVVRCMKKPPVSCRQQPNEVNGWGAGLSVRRQQWHKFSTEVRNKEHCSHAVQSHSSKSALRRRQPAVIIRVLR